MPQVALVCVAIMLGGVTYGHYLFQDDLPPPIVLMVAALVAAATWPAGKQKAK
eukprot:CAMPEP_0174739082 /NCGR_PEP_ID=MMETSP1094-20130205/71025_1 /TAXON_ID=156173 /ORGANISM="Chrysochromulina brevifilum, Strain UTEX LB 985" /LENGTH=52 /DNA_ID=CAMNT_0015942599 /DNA_START=82 /DNA_END=240 /DNA_ORIENTATION=+